MFTQRIKLPSGVLIERLFDVKTIVNGDKEVSFFTANPNGIVTDNNYSQNPLPGTDNRVILGFSFSPTMAIVRETANIDPQLILANLMDASVTFSSNEGRVQDFEHPLKDYLNLTGASSTFVDDGTSQFSAVALQSTGRRETDNLYYLRPNERFTLKVNFKNSVWPTSTHWNSAGIGRFGLKAQIYVASLNEAQLNAYRAKYAAA